MEHTLTRQENRELEEFLRPSRIAVVATVGPTGMPQLTPNWYVFLDGRIAISTTKERIKYRNLSRDSRLAVCIYSEPGGGRVRIRVRRGRDHRRRFDLASDSGDSRAVRGASAGGSADADASHSRPHHHQLGAPTPAALRNGQDHGVAPTAAGHRPHRSDGRNHSSPSSRGNLASHIEQARASMIFVPLTRLLIPTDSSVPWALLSMGSSSGCEPEKP